MEAEPAARAVGRLLAEQSIERLAKTLSLETPELALATVDWLRSLSTAEPADYFTHPEAFPMLLLPWWMEESITGSVDEAFQSELAYSSVTGYYFVRLLDDVMDGESPLPAAVPAAIVFHTEFMRAYGTLFQHEDRFWPALYRFSYDSAETASADARLGSVDYEDFVRISARKISGAKIPLAAVAHRHERVDVLDQWLGFVDLLGRWHQMRNDLQGWVGDLERGRATYFLSQANRRAADAESVPQWMAREGLTWAARQLDVWMDALLVAAVELGSPPLVAYLEQRRDTAAAGEQSVAADLAALSRLAASLGSNEGRAPAER